MSRSLLILLIALVSNSVYSVGLEVSYKNNSLVPINLNKMCSVPCFDTADEVEWMVDAYKPDYSIQVDSPNKKYLIIKKASIYDTGVYTCVSKKNPDVFSNIVVHVKIFPRINATYDLPIELC